MIDEREIWACAEQVLRQHGDRADAVIAGRIRDLAVKGDVAGVDIWSAIADRVDQLRDLVGAGQARH